jgi:hydroxyquinol 1,2-dioxygenase
MTAFDETGLTDAVITRFDACTTPRLREVLASLVRHLHGFVRDVEPTVEEWEAAIGFLTRTGQMCDDRRQEFILLSDTLGVSMLVDAINHRAPDGATETTVQGPFYVADPPRFARGADIRGTVEGRPLFVEGAVRGVDGRPVPGAVVDVWQSDDAGHYDIQVKPPGEVHLRGRIEADEAGRFWFWTILPNYYPIPTDGPVGALLAATQRHPYRPAHVHYMIAAPGFRRLVTHVFVAGDPYLESDAVFGVKPSLISDIPLRERGVTPDGVAIDRPHHHLSYDFTLVPA